MFCSVCGGEVQSTDRFCPKCGQTVSYAAPAAYAAQPGVSAPPMMAHRYAGFWLRFVAYLIDDLIVGIPSCIIALVAIVMTGGFAALAARFPKDPNPDPAQVSRCSVSMFGLFAIIAILLTRNQLALFRGDWKAQSGKRRLANLSLRCA